MIARLWLLLSPWLWLTCWFGGKSSASTTTSTNYNISDDRIAAAEGANVFRSGAEQAIGGGDILKVSGNANTVESLSDDVVFAAFDYAKSRDALAGETLDNVFKSTADLYGRANDAFLVANTAPRGQLTERTILIGGALLSVLAFAFFRMRKA